VYVLYGRKQNVLRIPFDKQFVQHGKGVYNIWVINGDQAEKRKVSLGESSYEYIEVISGLNKGERVILSGMEDRKQDIIKIK